jgi:cytochrome P450
MAGEASVADLASEVALLDATFYDDPFPVYGRLRREAPVFWHEAGECWAVSRYEDVREVGRRTDVFSREQGALPGDNLKPDRGNGLMPPGAEVLSKLDPPRHAQLRRIVGNGFTPRFVASLEPAIRQVVERAVDSIEPGVPGDVVELVAAQVPLQVIATMLDLPDGDLDDFRRWSDAAISFPDFQHDDPAFSDAIMALLEMWQYLAARVEERRARPGDDIISALLAAEYEGVKLNDQTLLATLSILLVGGNETTRHLISGALNALARDPRQRAVLTERPELIPSAVEELNRWVTPTLSTGYTTLAEVTLAGQTIPKGDYVLVLYQSANRDETIWDRADELDVARSSPASHLSFGFGQHSCAGAALARLETQLTLETILSRYPTFELAGEPVRKPNIFVNGLASLPMVFSPSAGA